jgi:predicted PhzF superfamily epimerase YddE/YHI9
LALKPNYAQMEGLAVGVLAPWRSAPAQGEAHFELRAFIAGDSLPEDPATGSLVAGIAQWLKLDARLPESSTFSQGTALQRACRIRVTNTADGIWIGGATKTLIEGIVHF